MPPSREELLIAATSFCDAFAAQSEPSVILGHFSKSNNAFALEHGLPQLAPFLGRRFSGLDGIKEYFSLIGDQLSYEKMRFVDYVVDAESSKVSVRGEARFTSKATGQGWDEVFTYVLGFDSDKKVEAYEIWADSGAAYLASRGELS